MLDGLLLKTQRNEVFEAISDRGFQPSQFEWQESRSPRRAKTKVALIVHRSTGHYFMFDNPGELRVSVGSPGGSTPKSSVRAETWDQQLSHVRDWLQCLEREIEAPDLWAEIAQERTLAEAASSAPATNRPFTPDEQSYISEQLHEIETYLITTQNLTEEHTEFVRTRLNYLGEAAERQGRQDWLHTAIGVVVTIVMGIALAPDAARELFRFVAGAFRQLLDGILSLPG